MKERHAIALCLTHRDPRGFEYLFRKYRRNAYFHSLSLLGNREDAADACQESFARAYSAMPALKQMDAFYPWFYRILRNCCLNMLSRRATVRKHQQAAEEQGEGVGLRGSETPEMLLVKGEAQVAVWQVLKALKPEFREVLLFKYMDGASYDLISRQLDIPRGTVMSRLYYARKAFREEYIRRRGSDGQGC